MGKPTRTRPIIKSIDGKDPKQFFLDWEKQVKKEREERALTFSLSASAIIKHFRDVCKNNLLHNCKCCQSCPFQNIILKVTGLGVKAKSKVTISVV